MDETAKEYEYFQAYLNQRPRNMMRLAQQLGVSKQWLYKISGDHEWKRRTDDHDRWIDSRQHDKEAQIQEKQFKSVTEMYARLNVISWDMIEKFAKAFELVSPEDLAHKKELFAEYERMVKLFRLGMGDATERTEVDTHASGVIRIEAVDYNRAIAPVLSQVEPAELPEGGEPDAIEGEYKQLPSPKEDKGES